MLKYAQEEVMYLSTMGLISMHGWLKLVRMVNYNGIVLLETPQALLLFMVLLNFQPENILQHYTVMLQAREMGM